MCCDLYCLVWKDLTFGESRLSAATCACPIELYLTHVQVKGYVHTLNTFT